MTRVIACEMSITIDGQVYPVKSPLRYNLTPTSTPEEECLYGEVLDRPSSGEICGTFRGIRFFGEWRFLQHRKRRIRKKYLNRLFKVKGKSNEQ